ncbi:MAG: Smr/MutS family protein [Spirochaetaceae bacterium]
MIPISRNSEIDRHAVEYPVEPVLDLHTFRPSEVADLVGEYLRACREQGLTTVELIHGKGSGSLARTVHATLSRVDFVESYELGHGPRGGWGRTRVKLTHQLL